MDPTKAHFQLSQKILAHDVAAGRYLLVRNAEVGTDFHRLYGPWDLPGGRVEAGEDVDAALMREVHEEIGPQANCTLARPYRPIARTVFAYPDGRRILVLAYYVRWAGGDIALSAEHDAVRWASAAEIGADPQVRPWIRDFVAAAPAP